MSKRLETDMSVGELAGRVIEDYKRNRSEFELFQVTAEDDNGEQFTVTISIRVTRTAIARAIHAQS